MRWPICGNIGAPSSWRTQYRFTDLRGAGEFFIRPLNREPKRFQELQHKNLKDCFNQSPLGVHHAFYFWRNVNVYDLWWSANGQISVSCLLDKYVAPTD